MAFDQKYLPYIVFGALVLFFVLKKKEGFANGESETINKVISEHEKAQSMNDPLSMHVEEIPIKPTFVNKDTRTIMSGSGFVLQKEVVPAWGFESYGANDALDDGAGGNLGLTYNLCSPSCCSDQWPVPHKLPVDKFICDNKEEYVPNSYTCSNQWQNSGCLCMTKKQGEFMHNRGGNA